MIYKGLNLREAKVSPSFPSDNLDCGYWDVKRFDSSLVGKPQECAAQYHLFTGCTESGFSNAKQNVWVGNKKVGMTTEGMDVTLAGRVTCD